MEGAATVTSCLMLESRSRCEELFMILKIYSNHHPYIIRSVKSKQINYAFELPFHAIFKSEGRNKVK